MGLRIQNNIAALNTHRQLVISDASLSRSLERLSSGFRINRAADDAAGLSVSMKFRAQIRSLQQGFRNAGQATSLLQVAEGGADQISNILSRMKELATQAASSNTTASDRTNIATEVDTLESEIDRIARSTKFGGTKLIDGTFGSTGVSAFGALIVANNVNSVDVSNASALTTFNVAITTSTGFTTVTINDQSGTTQAISVTINTIDEGSTQTLNFSNLGISVVVNADFDETTTNSASGDLVTGALGASKFQVGNENNADNQISFSLGDLTVAGLSVNVDVGNLSGAQTALTTIDSAITTLANKRSEIGVAQNRFGFASANLATSIENITAAESVIRDADLAFETINFTKSQILTQAGISILAQANLAPRSVLSLLG
ncbi:MAG: hypothetical protein JYX80_13055 [Candidatus Scalindua sediminis]|nr:hypothetical protein [Candidatus Scalindua sediminis]